MPLPCAVRVVAVRHCPISALGARGGAFCMSIGVPMCGWLAKGHVGAILVHLFGPQKQEKPPLSAFRRGFCQNNGGEDEIMS